MQRSRRANSNYLIRNGELKTIENSYTHTGQHKNGTMAHITTRSFIDLVDPRAHAWVAILRKITGASSPHPEIRPPFVLTISLHPHPPANYDE